MYFQRPRQDGVTAQLIVLHVITIPNAIYLIQGIGARVPHKLSVLVRTAWHNLYFEANIRKYHIFHMKIKHFYTFKNCCILNRLGNVMNAKCLR